MILEQYTLTIESRALSCSLITEQVIASCPAIKKVEKGFLQLFLRHTSASLSINENADQDVRTDLVASLDRIVPESTAYRHREEGPDDMPAHVKSVLLGVSLQIPINQGRLMLGTWQGIYLCEHRRQNHKREVIGSVWGV